MSYDGEEIVPLDRGRDSSSADALRTLDADDVVEIHERGHVIRGTVTHAAEKYVRIRARSGCEWRVSPHSDGTATAYELEHDELVERFDLRDSAAPSVHGPADARERGEQQ